MGREKQREGEGGKTTQEKARGKDMLCNIQMEQEAKPREGELPERAEIPWNTPCKREKLNLK